MPVVVAEPAYRPARIGVSVQTTIDLPDLTGNGMDQALALVNLARACGAEEIRIDPTGIGWGLAEATRKVIADNKLQMRVTK